MHAQSASLPLRSRVGHGSLARALALALVLAAPETGRAQPVRTEAIPGQESGRLDPIDRGDGAARSIGRWLLFVPRIAIQASFAPVRAAIWADERYRIRDRMHAVLFNDAETMGILPTLGLESGFGFTAGARFVHRDLFGRREHMTVAVATGGRYRERASTSLRTGDRLGGLVSLELEAEYDRRPKERFYGIGNGDVAMPRAGPIDALDGEVSAEARYRQRLMRTTAVVDVRLASHLHVRGSGALTDLEVARSAVGAPIDAVYRPDTLIGWSGARHVYTELELRWDGRRRLPMWESQPLHTAGWFAGVYAGPVMRIDGGRNFWRYGADVQHFLRLGRGPRVFAARAHVEAVSGARAEVPFFDLPQLGGATLLRGYPTERFRDRIAMLGSIDYQWDLSQRFSASVFADAGRVYASARELGLDDLRVGYGVGLTAHSKTRFRLRGSIASSIDGGVFLHIAFEPVFDIASRVEKR